MNKHRLLLLILLFYCNLFGELHAANEERLGFERYNFTAITMDDGLPHNFVDDMLKDKRGFLWIATAGGGIARYDGYNFSMNSQHLTLKSNFVKKMCEDAWGRLWLATEEGLDFVDTHTLQSVNIPDKSGSLSQLYHRPLQYIYYSKAGNIWVCAGNTLFKIILNEKGEVVQVLKIHIANKLEERLFVLQEIDGYIWLESQKSICKIKEEAMTRQVPMLVSQKLKFNQDHNTSSIYQKENEVWIGTNQGVYRYNRNTDTMKHYYYQAENNGSLSQDYVTDITETSEHIILISTLKGINLYNPLTDQFERIGANTGKEYLGQSQSINCDFVNCVLRDGNIVWIGTDVGGLNKMTIRNLSVRNYYHSPRILGSLSPNPVNVIYNDDAGILWVGTVEGGLNVLLPGSDSFSHYNMDSPARMNHNSVSALAADEDGKLWVGTWGGGLGWIDRKNLANKTYHPIETPAGSDISAPFIATLCYDKLNKALWIVTNEDVYIYDLEKQTFSKPFKRKKEGVILGCLGGCIDQHNQLWLGTTEGLYKIDLTSLKKPKLNYRIYRYRLDDPESKQHLRVSSIYESEDGIIWIGTNGNGVYRATRKEEGDYLFESYTTRHGLVDNSVRGIAEDNEKNIWISTNNGLSCFNPQSEVFQNYTKKDGLACNQFYWNAFCKGRNNTLYFGTLAGMTSIVPGNRALRETNDIPIVFTHLHVFGEDRFAENNILYLHESDKLFSIEFAALDYDTPDFASYSYRLKGFDDKWTETSVDHRFASFTNLHPGKYIFELCYSPDKKNNSKQTAELTIIIEPYFYKTIWFILFVFAIVAFSIYRIIIWRLNSFKAQKELLRIKVEERTRELEKQKLLLAGQATELSQQNDLLKQQNEEITTQKGQIIEMSMKVQELTVDKISFFTNITHEFRTPLTLIVGPIERALKLSCNPQVIEQLHFIERNSKYLLSLVNQLMDFRKLESGKMTINLNPGNFIKFLDELMLSFSAYAADQGITLEKQIRLSSPNLMYDEDAMHKVLVNLIANALKFTPRGGTVTIYVSSMLYEDKETLFLCIKDTGTGIIEEDIDKVFNRFYQSQKQLKSSVLGQSSTGIGLYLCQRIIHLHNGHIYAKNNRGKGCSFRIAIPLIHCDFIEEVKTDAVKAEPADNIPELTNGKLTILVVEDNKDMRDYIRSILIEYYNVLEASQGEEALALLHSQTVNFIVSDLMMPVMDGMELSRRVKADFVISHLPFLMLTAKTSNEARIEGFNIGIDEYLLKPFDDNLLLARIANILENRKRMQQKFTYNMDVAILNVEEDSSDKKFLDKAMQVVKENFKNSYYEVSDFIEAMGVSKSLLNKKMQNLTGQSAGQFIRNYRLNIARELILKNRTTHNMNISEIAYEVGFNDPKYFTRCFTKHFSITPSSLFEKQEM